MMEEHTINEIIIKKIDGSKMEKKIKEIVKEILDIERRHMQLRYPRFSEDYDKIISKYLVDIK